MLLEQTVLLWPNFAPVSDVVIEMVVLGIVLERKETQLNDSLISPGIWCIQKTYRYAASSETQHQPICRQEHILPLSKQV